MPDAQSILSAKRQRPLVVADPADSVLEAAERMNENHVGSLLVVQGERLIGIFTERDILRRVVAARRDPATTKVGDVMTSPVACAAPHTTREELGATMREERIRHVPVVENGHLLGMISIGDLNRAENAEQAETIRYLEQYMSVP